MTDKKSYFITGDVGGTNSRIQLFSINILGTVEYVFFKVYSSNKYNSLLSIINQFLIESKINELPLIACIAIAGPIKNNTCHVTNLNWGLLDGDSMGTELGIKKFLLINDFAAIGYGLLALKPKDYIKLNNAVADNKAPIACLGAGTGLGEVFLTHNKKQYDVWGSEGGHACFAPRNKFELELMEFIQHREKLGRVSVERIVSGLGMPLIYEFLLTKHPELENKEITAGIRKLGGSVITSNGTAGTDKLCVKTLELMISCYGAEAGNLAIKTLSFGGLFVAGGIAPRVLSNKNKAFQEIFFKNYLNKGRMRKILETVPVYIVTHGNVGLLGAQVMALRLLDEVGVAVKEQSIIDTEVIKPLTPTSKL